MKYKIKNRLLRWRSLCIITGVAFFFAASDPFPEIPFFPVAVMLLFLLSIIYSLLREFVPLTVTVGDDMRLRHLLFTRKISLDSIDSIKYWVLIMQHEKKIGSRWVVDKEFRVCAEIGCKSGDRRKVIRLNDSTGIKTRERSALVMSPELYREDRVLYFLCQKLTELTGVETEMLPDKLKERIF